MRKTYEFKNPEELSARERMKEEERKQALEEHNERFRESLRRLIDQKRVSERCICARLGVNSGYVSKILSGKVYPSYMLLFELSPYFGVSIGTLFGENLSFDMKKGN